MTPDTSTLPRRTESGLQPYSAMQSWKRKQKSGCRSHEHDAPPGTEIGQRSARGSNGDRYGKSAQKSKTEKAIQIRSLFSTGALSAHDDSKMQVCGAVYHRTEHTAGD